MRPPSVRAILPVPAIPATPRWYDDVSGYRPPRWRILWLDGYYDCRTYTYYCDIRNALSEFHEVIPVGRALRLNESDVDLIVVGYKHTAAMGSVEDALGISRRAFSRVPLVVLVNKVYTGFFDECAGQLEAKLRWPKEAGAAVAFSRNALSDDLSRKYGTVYHWLPFAFDVQKYAPHAGPVDGQPCDVGFKGASAPHKYPLRVKLLAALRDLKHVMTLLAAWYRPAGKPALMGRACFGHADAGYTYGYASYLREVAATKIWISTEGPETIPRSQLLVGQRYFEVLASGTTLLLCSRLPEGQYHHLFEDGKHVVMFDSPADMVEKIHFYLSRDGEERRR